MINEYQDFYKREYSSGEYANVKEMENHPFYKKLYDCLICLKLLDSNSLEIGSGRGALQDIVYKYTGVDCVQSLKEYYHKKYICCSATNLPFDDNTYNLIWSYATLEHIANIEAALEEMYRVIRSGGYIILEPAWQCRPWASNGYQVRPYGDFSFWGKIYKFLIPFLNSILFRSLTIFPYRLLVLANWIIRRNPLKLHYKRLKPNYETFWQSDSDACNSLDPFQVLMWFESRGCRCISHPSILKKFLIRTGMLIFIVNK